MKFAPARERRRSRSQEPAVIRFLDFVSPRPDSTVSRQPAGGRTASHPSWLV